MTGILDEMAHALRVLCDLSDEQDSPSGVDADEHDAAILNARIILTEFDRVKRMEADKRRSDAPDTDMFGRTAQEADDDNIWEDPEMGAHG